MNVGEIAWDSMDRIDVAQEIYSGRFELMYNWQLLKIGSASYPEK
jgi:hypothetical protein